MSTRIIALIAAALSGSAMTFQGVINAELSERTNQVIMATVVQLVGLVSALVLLVLSGAWRNFGKLSGTPWHSYLGGLIGVGIIMGVAFTIPRTGAALGISAILIAQLLTAVLCDHFGWFSVERVPITWIRVIGTALMVIGARLLVVPQK